MESAAYDDGYAAFDHGAWPDDCPHAIGSQEAKDWLRGYHARADRHKEIAVAAQLKEEAK
jgi:hypothetical protein